jgi:glyoxylase-like metal-dependent hydrolase (beta-lactamase superfamily II)
MSEPTSSARMLLAVVPGVVRWSVKDDRIGGVESCAHAVVRRGSAVLIDPLPLAASALRRLGRIEAIVLTAANHQRSAFRLRRELSVPVLAPRGPGVGQVPGELEEEPDRRYGDRDELPFGLRALFAPGPAHVMYALWHPSKRVLFLSDQLTREARKPPRFVEDSYQDEPARTRETVRALAERLPVRVLCFAHGPPVLRGAREALRAALR